MTRIKSLHYSLLDVLLVHWSTPRKGYREKLSSSVKRRGKEISVPGEVCGLCVRSG